MCTIAYALHCGVVPAMLEWEGPRRTPAVPECGVRKALKIRTKSPCSFVCLVLLYGSGAFWVAVWVSRLFDSRMGKADGLHRAVGGGEPAAKGLPICLDIYSFMMMWFKG